MFSSGLSKADDDDDIKAKAANQRIHKFKVFLSDLYKCLKSQSIVVTKPLSKARFYYSFGFKESMIDHAVSLTLSKRESVQDLCQVRVKGGLAILSRGNKRQRE